MIRRSSLDAAGAYDERLNHAEDFDLWLRLGEANRIELIPEILDDGKQAGYLKHKGKFVTTKLDRKTLEQLASISSGKYIQASADAFGVDRFLKEIDKLKKAETQKRIKREYRDSFQLLLFLALLLLLLEAALGSRRWSMRKKQPALAANKATGRGAGGSV